mgnify:CR=1 FL=1
MININMRCIEMHENFVSLKSQCGLTLTWDVLKSLIQWCCIQCRLRLTLTWDVLKWNENLVS